MPQATVSSSNNAEKFDLKTCPGGYVCLRRMTYGEKLNRQQMSSKMSFTGGKKDFEGTMDLVNTKVREIEFQKCIVDHNLEDESGRKLDFRNKMDIHSLDPKIGDEIDELISDMNNYDEEDEEGNSGGESEPRSFSTEEPTTTSRSDSP